MIVNKVHPAYVFQCYKKLQEDFISSFYILFLKAIDNLGHVIKLFRVKIFENCEVRSKFCR